jgi:hypothetical protein
VTVGSLLIPEHLDTCLTGAPAGGRELEIREQDIAQGAACCDARMNTAIASGRSADGIEGNSLRWLAVPQFVRINYDQVLYGFDFMVTLPYKGIPVMGCSGLLLI